MFNNNELRCKNGTRQSIRETGISKVMKLFTYYKDTNVNALIEIIKKTDRILHEESVIMFDENYLYISA